MFPIHRILHPTTFDSSDEALGTACSLAQDYRAELIILHAVPLAAVMYGPPSESYLDHVLQELRCMRPDDPKVLVEHLVVEGDAAAQILKVAADSRCALIVMGTHGRTGVDRLLNGSVAEAVIRGASCPVLTVKEVDKGR